MESKSHLCSKRIWIVCLPHVIHFGLGGFSCFKSDTSNSCKSFWNGGKVFRTLDQLLLSEPKSALLRSPSSR